MDTEKKGIFGSGVGGGTSQNAWDSLTPDWGTYTLDRAMMMSLQALYQKSPIVHGAVDILAKAVVGAGASVCRVVDQQAKSLGGKSRTKKLSKQRHKKFASRVKDMGDDQSLLEIASHPVIDVLMSSIRRNLRLLSVSMAVFGIGYLYKERGTDGSGTGAITNYRFLPAYNVEPERDGEGKVVGYFWSNFYGYGQTPEKEPLALEDIVVFRWPSPTDPEAGGDSPLLSAVITVELAAMWLEYQTRLLRNRARIDLIIPVDEETTPEEADRVVKTFNRKAKGPNAGGVLAVPASRTPVPMVYSPTDLAPLQFNSELQTAVLFALNMPESFANNDGNRANLEGGLEQFARFCLDPHCSLFEEVLTEDLQLETGDDAIVFVFEEVIPEDEQLQLQQDAAQASIWNAGVIAKAVTIEEYRLAVFGLPPLTPEQMEDMAPSQPDESESSEDPEDQESESSDEPDPAPDATPDDAKSFDLLSLNRSVSVGEIDRCTAINIVSHTLKITEDDAKRLVTFPVKKGVTGPVEQSKALKPPKLTTGKALAGVIRKQIGRQKSHYLAQLVGGKSLTDSIQKMFADDISQKDDDDRDNPSALPTSFTELDNWDADDMEAYLPYIQLETQTAANGRIAPLVRAGAEKGVFSVVPQQVAEAVKQSTMRFAASTNASTKQNLNDALVDLKKQITEGTLEGDPLPAMRKRVEDIFEDLDKGRAAMIAQTETSRAVHVGQKIAAKASGIVKGFKLLVDDDCCDVCQEFADKEIGLDDKFNTDDDYDDSPLPVHPNCRCTMLEIIDTDALEGDDD